MIGAFIFHHELSYTNQVLAASLAHDATHSTLKEIGYPIQRNWRALLGFLYRYSREAPSFPHEVGFFLGYPPEDVLGFRQCPRNCKLCGVWKVYGDEARAALCFDEYARCRERLLAYIHNGGSILSDSLRALAG